MCLVVEGCPGRRLLGVEGSELGRRNHEQEAGSCVSQRGWLSHQARQQQPPHLCPEA